MLVWKVTFLTRYMNDAYQIMKKVFPKAFADGVEGVALHPVRVSIVWMVLINK